MESYAKGESEPALLEETIGANLDRTVAQFPDREAMVEFATREALDLARVRPRRRAWSPAD